MPDLLIFPMLVKPVPELMICRQHQRRADGEACNIDSGTADPESNVPAP